MVVFRGENQRAQKLVSGDPPTQNIQCRGLAIDQLDLKKMASRRRPFLSFSWHEFIPFKFCDY